MAEKEIGFNFECPKDTKTWIWSSETHLSIKYIERLEKCENDRRDLYQEKWQNYE